MKKILLLGAGGAAAQNFIRSLRLQYKKGDLYVVGTDVNKYQLARSDCDSKYLVSPCNNSNYINTLNKIIKKEKVQGIHAQPDIEVECISENREKLGGKVFLPSKSAIRICRNKEMTMCYLQKAGVPVAKFISVKSEDDINKAFSSLIRTDNKLWLRASQGAGSKAALPVDSVELSKEWIRYWKNTNRLETEQFMLSEVLSGTEYAFQSLWYNGELITSCARERVEYMFGNLMPSGQSSSPSVARTVINQEVNNIAYNAINAVNIKPHGVYCVDLKEDKYGVPCVTEINAGRFFTTSIFFSRAEANMPYYYIRLMFNDAISDVFDLPKFNALPPNIYCIRGVDREEWIVGGNEWSKFFNSI